MVIYKTTNLVNGRQYIGKSVRNRPSYLGSGSILKKAIQKYGKENFVKEIIDKCSSIDELKEREEYWLNYYDAARNPMFYNTHNYSYGSGIGELATFYGRHHSDDTKNKLIEILSGRQFSDETRKKMSKSKKGKRFSESHRNKLSESKMGNTNSPRGKDHPNFKGYIICISGIYEGTVVTRTEAAKLINVCVSDMNKHLYGKRYISGIKGTKWSIVNNQNEQKEK